MWIHVSDKCISTVAEVQGNRPGVSDSESPGRKGTGCIGCGRTRSLEAPAALLRCQSGKHVWRGEACRHNPAEGELLVAASKNINGWIQMGTRTVRAQPLCCDKRTACRLIGDPILHGRGTQHPEKHWQRCWDCCSSWLYLNFGRACPQGPYKDNRFITTACTALGTGEALNKGPIWLIWPDWDWA
jgi:hypothetical protein